MNIRHLILLTAIFSGPIAADDSTLDAAIGGGVGGAVGAAIGNEAGGREGAIAGGAIGAAVGTAITTKDSASSSSDNKVAKEPAMTGYHPAPGSGAHPGSRHCPPGQAKKGRC